LIKSRYNFFLIFVLLFVFAAALFSCISNSVNVVETGNEIKGTTETVEVETETVQKEKILIGYENWRQPDEFIADVQSGILDVEDKYNVKTVIFDSDGMNSTENIDKMVSSCIKGAIEYYRDPISAKQSINVIKAADIPVVSLNYPVPDSVYVGVNNYDSGFMAGKWMGDYAADAWAGNVDLVIIVYSPLEGEFVGQLFQGIEKGIKSGIEVPEEKIARVDGGGNADQTVNAVKSALNQFPEANRILIGVENDACAIGAADALNEVNRADEAVIVSQGMQKTMREIIMNGDTPIKAGVAYFPEKYGEVSIQALLDIMADKNVPDMIYINTVVITKDNISDYYP